MSRRLLASILLGTWAQTWAFQPGFAATISPSGNVIESAQPAIQSRIKDWIDRYLEEFSSDRTFAKRLGRHLDTLMLQEDSVSFLQNLVDRRALRQNIPIESYFEEYVHFITWQSLRRVPDASIPQYLELMTRLSQSANDALCRELLYNKSAIGFVRPRDQFRLISQLAQQEQEQYFKLVALGFKRLTSGAYPQTRLSEGEIAQLQESYLVFQGEAGKNPGACEKITGTIRWIQTDKARSSARSALWRNGLLPISEKEKKRDDLKR